MAVEMTDYTQATRAQKISMRRLEPGLNAQIKATARLNWQDNEYKRHVAIGLSKKLEDPDFHASKSRGMERGWQNPEYQARRKQGQTAYFERTRDGRAAVIISKGQSAFRTLADISVLSSDESLKFSIGGFLDYHRSSGMIVYAPEIKNQHAGETIPTLKYRVRFGRKRFNQMVEDKRPLAEKMASGYFSDQDQRLKFLKRAQEQLPRAVATFSGTPDLPFESYLTKIINQTSTGKPPKMAYEVWRSATENVLLGEIAKEREITPDEIDILWRFFEEGQRDLNPTEDLIERFSMAVARAI